jgi:hypothetical protein
MIFIEPSLCSRVAPFYALIKLQVPASSGIDSVFKEREDVLSDII